MSDNNHSYSDHLDWFYVDKLHNVDRKPLDDFAKKFVDNLDVSSIEDMDSNL